MWIETKLIIDGGYQEAIIQPSPEQNSVVLKVVEVEENRSVSLYLSYNEALRLANELIDFVSKNKGK